MFTIFYMFKSPVTYEKKGMKKNQVDKQNPIELITSANAKRENVGNEENDEESEKGIILYIFPFVSHPRDVCVFFLMNETRTLRGAFDLRNNGR